MKIIVLDGYTLNPGDLSWKRIADHGTLTIYDRTTPEDVAERIGNAEIVFTNKTVLKEEHFSRCSNLKYIGVLATGYNVVDIAAAQRHGICVTNIPTYGTTAVAQYTIAMILELCHHIGEHNRTVQQGRWSSSKDFCYWDYPLVELKEKTLGIIGYGRIGQAVGKLAQAFGMNILAYDQYQIPNAEAEYVSLDEIFSRADILSLHCPLFPETKELIREENIQKMKPGTLLINTSRGGLVKEADLARALKNGIIAGAALDVVSTEPISIENPLLGLENCIITPHIAWAPKESRERLMNIAADNLEAFLQGNLINIVL